MRNICSCILSLVAWFMLSSTALARQSILVGGTRARQHQLTCGVTRQDTWVSVVQDAQSAMDNGLDRVYTGQGILVGIIDTGIEYNHLNFRNPITGETRLKGAVLYRPEEGAADSICEYYVDAAAIDTLTTDTRFNNHGTQTASVAAASYPGLGLLGMAPQSDLMLCGTSSLTDDRLIDGLRRIFARADELEVPCVVNLSIGNPLGWKDGLSDFCLACDSITEGGNAPGRIIILSAGNDGAKPFAVQHTFKSQQFVYTMLQPAANQGKKVYFNPNVDVYCSDSLPVSLDYVLYDTIKHEFSDCPFEQHLLDTLEAGHDGRRHLCVDADTCWMTEYPNQMLVARFGGQPGSSFVAYYVNDESVNYTMAKAEASSSWLLGTAELSISDLCCTDAVVSVGSYSAVDAVKNIFGRQLSSWSPKGEVCSFSSYGETWQGSPKPDVLCPGANVVTGFSAYHADKIEYYTSGRYSNSPMIHVLTPQPDDAPWYLPDSPGRTYYWIASVGTSLSSPALAGIVALWLEACPTLSVRDIRSLLQHTSRFDDYCLSAPGGIMQAGAGKVDALRGLQEILQGQGIVDIRDGQEVEPMLFDMMGRQIPRSTSQRQGLFIDHGHKIVLR